MDLAGIDLEKLDFGSDYTPFMQAGVPDDVRNGALRKLWASDPVFSLHDGLDDCCGDYSDAVWALPDLKTAYRIGRGFLSDEEVERWANLGKPPPVSTVQAVNALGDAAMQSDVRHAGDVGFAGPSDVAAVAGNKSAGALIAEERKTPAEHAEADDEKASPHETAPTPGTAGGGRQT